MVYDYSIPIVSLDVGYGRISLKKKQGKDPKSSEPSEKMNSYMSLGKEEAKFRKVS